MEKLKNLADSVINGKAPETEKLTQELLDAGVTPDEVLNKGLILGMDEVGRRFRNNEFYVPEVLIAARAMKAGMKILRPKLVESGVKPMAKIVLGTVKGDLHDIGKNIVATMLRVAGFKVIDLGVDVSPEAFLEAVKKYKPDIVGMSALLTTTMIEMENVIKELEKAGVRKDVKIIVGGAAVTEDFAKKIGADAYGKDAVEAVAICKRLVGVS